MDERGGGRRYAKWRKETPCCAARGELRRVRSRSEQFYIALKTPAWPRMVGTARGHGF